MGSSCALCGAENVGLLFANHKQLGSVAVCQDCWQNVWSKNEFLSNVTCSGSTCSTSSCGGCR